MGIDYRACTIVGVKIDLENVPRKIQRERGCEHPATEGKYCPECGRPTWEEYQQCADWVDEFREWVCEESENELPDGYGSETVFDQDIYFIGLATQLTEKGEEPERLDIPDFDEVRSTLQRVLTAKGVWNDEVAESFGIWTTFEGS